VGPCDASGPEEGPAGLWLVIRPWPTERACETAQGRDDMDQKQPEKRKRRYGPLPKTHLQRAQDCLIRSNRCLELARRRAETIHRNDRWVSYIEGAIAQSQQACSHIAQSCTSIIYTHQPLPARFRSLWNHLTNLRGFFDEALALAKQHNLTPLYIDGIQSCFDTYQDIYKELDDIITRLELAAPPSDRTSTDGETSE